MTFPRSLEPLVADVLAAHRAWEATWQPYEQDATMTVDVERLRAPLAKLAERLRENYPHFHPLYAGQMLKPPHPAAVLGYLAAMLVNPNNHALDGGRATAAMEKECVAALAKMFGYRNDRFLGHLTSSGTVANLEALWAARELHGDLPIVFSSEAHYTHKRMCELLRAPYVELPATADGRLDIAALDALLGERRIGTVVATLGTTALGAIDPLPAILERRAREGFRVHVDAAYGGYFRLLAAREPGLASFRATGEADSVVVDPHKHGLQPYGSGCVLFADAAVAKVYAHASPYTYFSSPDHHPGETTLECSRAGAAAAALWLTMQVLPLDDEGATASSAASDRDPTMVAILGRCLAGARAFAERVRASSRFALHLEPELDIVTYYPRAESMTAISAAADAIFARAEAAAEPVYLAKLVVDASRFAALHPDVAADAPRVTILRSCLMRPEQGAWADEIVARLDRLATI